MSLKGGSVEDENAFVVDLAHGSSLLSVAGDGSGPVLGGTFATWAEDAAGRHSGHQDGRLPASDTVGVLGHSARRLRSRRSSSWRVNAIERISDRWAGRVFLSGLFFGEVCFRVVGGICYRVPYRESAGPSEVTGGLRAF